MFALSFLTPGRALISQRNVAFIVGDLSGRLPGRQHLLVIIPRVLGSGRVIPAIAVGEDHVFC